MGWIDAPVRYEASKLDSSLRNWSFDERSSRLDSWLKRVAGEEGSRIEAELLFSENQFNNTVIILGSEAVRMGLEKLDTKRLRPLRG